MLRFLYLHCEIKNSFHLPAKFCNVNLRASSREEAEISGAAEVENHPCLSGFLLPNLPFTEMVTSPEMPLLVR